MPSPRPELSAPPDYREVVRDEFRIEPGLYPFPTDFKQGKFDDQAFQIDTHYHAYLSAKMHARRRDPEAVYCTSQLTPQAEAAVCRFIVERMAQDHPAYFSLERSNDEVVLHNALIGSQHAFRATQAGLQWQAQSSAATTYRDGIEVLAMQLQEDFAIITREPDRNRLSAIHLCFPNNWHARDKIGRSFGEVHGPVPHFERIASIESSLVDAMIHRGPYVRFAWGLSLDGALDHAPRKMQTPGRFDPQRPRLFLRVERQCLFGLPEHDCALFTIRTYHYEVNRHQTSRRLVQRLYSALASMSPQVLDYKGLRADREAILKWLAAADSGAAAR